MPSNAGRHCTAGPCASLLGGQRVRHLPAQARSLGRETDGLVRADELRRQPGRDPGAAARVAPGAGSRRPGRHARVPGQPVDRPAPAGRIAGRPGRAACRARPRARNRVPDALHRGAAGGRAGKGRRSDERQAGQADGPARLRRSRRRRGQAARRPQGQRRGFDPAAAGLERRHGPLAARRPRRCRRGHRQRARQPAGRQRPARRHAGRGDPVEEWRNPRRGHGQGRCRRGSV